MLLDVPMEFVRTNYRTIMQKLKAYLGLDGDTWIASVIDEAYRTLIDHDKKVHYDAEIVEGNKMKDLDLQSKAQPYKETEKESEPIGFTATWQ